jgi:hypothetical protein
MLNRAIALPSEAVKDKIPMLLRSDGKCKAGTIALALHTPNPNEENSS